MNEIDNHFQTHRSTGRFWTGLILLAIVHLILSSWSARNSSVTFDEPVHTIGGWTVDQWNDYRLEPENPILFERFSGLLSSSDELNFTADSPIWQAIRDDPEHTLGLISHNVYAPPADIDGMVNRRRPQFALLGSFIVIGVGLLTRSIGKACDPRQLSPRSNTEAGALLAAGLTAFNPSLLGHAPLVKNDVMLALAALWVMGAAWLVLKRASWRNITLLALGIATAPLVKFSGLIFAPAIALALMVRAFSRYSWPVLGFNCLTRRTRFIGVFSITIFILIFLYGFIWFSYGFRFSATADGSPLNFDWLAKRSAARAFFDTYGTPPPIEVVSQLQPTDSVRCLIWLNSIRFLPEPFTYGLINVSVQARTRLLYLLGESGFEPSIWYFPTSIALKEPLANLALLALIPIAFWIFRKRLDSAPVLCVACAMLPAIFFFAAAILGPLTIGIRHILPIFPAIFVLIGVAGVALWPRHRLIRIVIASLFCLSALETMYRAPQFISFFNPIGQFLNRDQPVFVDSNIDWGQDLKLLAQWQREHPGEALYVSYFGSVDPAIYGIRYVPLHLHATSQNHPSGVVAISIVNLYEMNHAVPIEQIRPFQDRQPFEILGGSIYLFRWPLEDHSRE